MKTEKNRRIQLRLGTFAHHLYQQPVFHNCTGRQRSMTQSDRQQRLLALLKSDGVSVHRLLVRLTLNETVADDLMQELFLRLSQSIPFDQAKNPVAYVRRTAMNLAFEWKRQRKRSVAGSLEEEPISVSQSPEDMIQQQEDMDMVLNALSELSEDARQVLVLHRLEGEPYDSIAEQMDKTSHQVRAICSKAIQRLRDVLNDDSASTSETQS